MREPGFRMLILIKIYFSLKYFPELWLTFELLWRPQCSATLNIINRLSTNSLFYMTNNNLVKKLLEMLFHLINNFCFPFCCAHCYPHKIKLLKQSTRPDYLISTHIWKPVWPFLHYLFIVLWWSTDNTKHGIPRQKGCLSLATDVLRRTDTNIIWN